MNSLGGALWNPGRELGRVAFFFPLIQIEVETFSCGCALGRSGTRCFFCFETDSWSNHLAQSACFLRTSQQSTCVCNPTFDGANRSNNIDELWCERYSTKGCTANLGSALFYIISHPRCVTHPLASVFDPHSSDLSFGPRQISTTQIQPAFRIP